MRLRREGLTMKTALLGIDVGTSACKVAAFDLEGHVLAQAAESYPVLYPQPGWAEQDPQQWWEAVCKALRRLWESGAVAPGGKWKCNTSICVLFVGHVSGVQHECDISCGIKKKGRISWNNLNQYFTEVQDED